MKVAPTVGRPSHGQVLAALMDGSEYPGSNRGKSGIYMWENCIFSHEEEKVHL